MSLPGIAVRESPTVAELTPASPEYAHLPILDGFCWQEWLSGVDSCTWYLVVFRSVRRADAPEQLLTEFDTRAHHEALQAGGLLLYFRGALDERRACLSLCIWSDREQARLALRLPRHQAAVRIARGVYESYRLERYWLTKSPGGAITATPVG